MEMTRSASVGMPSPKNGSGSLVLKLIIGVVTLALVGGGSYFLVRAFGPGGVDSSKYQAVFLSNGQVYFGKLKGLGGNAPVLEDVYYLVINQPLQGQEGEKPVQPKYTLVKLGREIHGPEDKLILQKRHILFVENLKDDGKLVAAIKQAASNPTSPVAPAAQEQAQPAPAQPTVPAETPSETPAETPAAPANTVNEVVTP